MSFSSLLADARRELLDTTLRNPLVNYSWEKTKRGVKMKSTHSNDVNSFFNDIIEAKPLQFTAHHGISPLKKYCQQIPTELSPENLQKRLVKLAKEALTFDQEQGFNVLHLACGFLEWYESDSSEQILLSPLLLLPFKLQFDDQGVITGQFTQEEPEDNASLRQKLSSDFGINLVCWADIDQDETVVNKYQYYTNSIGEQIGKHTSCQRWVVHPNKVALDLFSFARLSMYQDLDPLRIQEAEVPILSTLLAPNGSFRAQYGGDMHIDIDALPATELDNIMVADSSQTEAIKRALRGDHLVIQGPPGTGKSQTIANLIASLVRNGKKVLFVAEKMAALSVVKRRLDHADLGQLCLELHSQKTRPKDVLAELKRTLYQPTSQPNQSLLEPVDKLIETREQIRLYYQQLTLPIEKTAISPYEAIGEFAKLTITPTSFPLRLIPELASVITWETQQFTLHRDIVDEARRRINETGPIRLLPFYGSELRTSTMLLQQEIHEVLSQLKETAQQLTETIKKAKHIGLPVEENSQLIAIADVFVQLKRITAKPTLTYTKNQLSPEWASQRSRLFNVFQAGKRLDQLQRDLDKKVISAAFSENIYLVRQAYQQYANKWYASFIGEFKQARRTLKSYCKTSSYMTVAEERILIDAIIEHKEQTRTLNKLIPTVQSWLQEVSTEDFEWTKAEPAVDFLINLHTDIQRGKFPDWGLIYLTSPVSELVMISTDFTESLRKWEDGWVTLKDKLLFSDSFLSDKLSAPRGHLINWIHQAQDTIHSHLQHTIKWNNSRAALNQHGLSSLVAQFEATENSADWVYDTYCYSIWAHLIDYARSKRPQLHNFHGPELRRLSALFSASENRLLAINQAQTKLYHQRKLPNSSAAIAIGQMGVLHREFSKHRRLLPLRKLFIEAGASIQAIKPVIMMSPLSISRYLPQQEMKFDVVIFDEASQVKPVDAFGALMRAEQAIVVGDEQQMPPTAFFDATLEGSDTDVDEIEDSLVKDTESILQLFVGREASQCWLQWHYRSQHESLIRISNQEFYDNRLLVTPSPFERGVGLGLRLERVDGIYQPNVGNLIEAKTVVQAILHHARTQPHCSLGVVALNMKQVDLIENLIDKIDDPVWSAFQKALPNEPFFVKSLESVQGDERDVIFISISFGKQHDGSIHMHFGPVNREGGHRRLNVLFSRAKRECVVFTGLRASDIRIGEKPSLGLPVLKSFLHFAETGEVQKAYSEGPGVESPFEESVKKVLEKAGYRVDTQIGASGFRIDLGVRDPASPEQQNYLTGIECDGATYHRSRAARDRDFIRQQVLEGMGWRIYRIWSTDWFHNNSEQQRKLLEHLELCKASSKKSVQRSPETNPTPILDTILVDEPPASTLTVPYTIHKLQLQTATSELHEVPIRRLLELTVELVQKEGPVHSDYAMKRIADVFGVSKVGSRIQQHFSNVFILGVNNKILFSSEEFLWTDIPSLNVKLRSREKIPSEYRKIEWVSPHEIQAAILILLQQNYASLRLELLQAVVKLLGFQRLTGPVQDVLTPILDQLIKKNRVVVRSDKLYLDAK